MDDGVGGIITRGEIQHTSQPLEGRNCSQKTINEYCEENEHCLVDRCADVDAAQRKKL